MRWRIIFLEDKNSSQKRISTLPGNFFSTQKRISTLPGRVSEKFFNIVSLVIIMHVLLLVPVYVLLSGCRRPQSFKNPLPEKPPIQLFQDAQNHMLSQLRFAFVHTGFEVLNGVSNDVLQVISKYPPTGLSPQMLNLHIEGLIEQIFLEFTTAKNFNQRDIECVRDYTQLCPERWIDVGDGTTCESPPELFENSQCRTILFGGLTPLEKSQSAWDCGESTYPCRNASCMQNYSQTCPTGWTLLGKSATCMAPQTYYKPCVTVYNFADHNWTQKRKFGDMCKVRWPCVGGT